MKKLLIALAGAACLFTQLPAKADQLQDIEKRGTIRIAVPQDFPPFGSVGTDLQPQGYVQGEIRQTAESLSINTTRYCAVLHLSVTVNMILDGSTATLTVYADYPLASVLIGGDTPSAYAGI